MCGGCDVLPLPPEKEEGATCQCKTVSPTATSYVRVNVIPFSLQVLYAEESVAVIDVTVLITRFTPFLCLCLFNSTPIHVIV